MSLKSILMKNSLDFRFEVVPFEISLVFTPYSKFFKTTRPLDIYSGNENITFENKDPEFKRIMFLEFL
ncbi:MAG: hypothetical protein P8Y23_06590 [Candidatus Lokiarchaeota archaeon]|jgi:hypothetical protein